ncbi:MAG TPA: hypothetical protein PKA74_19415 [Bauldia sp.]|nr:hypothetical protein [Bauldia sp.]
MTTEPGRIVDVGGDDGLALVVRHDRGYTAVRLARGADSVAVGDQVWGYWTTPGAGTLKTADGQTFPGVFGAVAATPGAAKAG